MRSVAPGPAARDGPEAAFVLSEARWPRIKTVNLGAGNIPSVEVGHGGITGFGWLMGRRAQLRRRWRRRVVRQVDTKVLAQAHLDWGILAGGKAKRIAMDIETVRSRALTAPCVILNQVRRGLP
jgi:hypothetical protein